MRVILWLALSLALGVVTRTGPAIRAMSPPRRQQSSAQATPPAPATSSTSSKVWIGRYADTKSFSALEIDRLANPKVGTTGGTKFASFKPGGLAARGALRNLRPARYDNFFESYKSEVAANKLDRLLELDMVPPAVERRYNGDPVSLQLFAENAMMLKEVKEKKLCAPDLEKWNYQLHRAYLFDDLWLTST